MAYFNELLQKNAKKKGLITDINEENYGWNEGKNGGKEEDNGANTSFNPL